MLIVDANVWVAAFDPHDRFHTPSVRFLEITIEERVWLAAPSILIVETACALARRTDDSRAAMQAVAHLRSHPVLRLQPMHDTLLDRAERLGIELRLRGADALYAATSSLLEAVLISWDKSLIRRAGAIEPPDWHSG